MTSETASPSEIAPRSESTLPRRTFLERASMLGATVVGAIAATWADAPSAMAGPYCCRLAFPNGPWCGGRRNTSDFRCRSGYHKRVWYCHTGLVFVGCYECTNGPTCWNPERVCSNYTVNPH